MLEVVALVLGASFIQALGTALQKREVANGFGELETRDFVLGFRRVFASLLRSRYWLLGFVIGSVGAVALVQAFSRADLSVVVPLGATSSVFTVVLGASMLSERIRSSEILAIAVVITGAILVGVDAGSPRHAEYPTSTSLLISALAVGLSGLLILARGLWPQLLPREVALSLAAAVQMGAGNLLIKATVEAVRAGLGAFSVTALATWQGIAARPEFWLCIATQVAGFVLLQTAFARGRVAVIGPLMTAGNTLVSLGGAVAMLGEGVSRGRFVGAVTLLAGTLAIAWLHEPAPERVRGTAPGPRASNPGAPHPTCPS